MCVFSALSLAHSLGLLTHSLSMIIIDEPSLFPLVAIAHDHVADVVSLLVQILEAPDLCDDQIHGVSRIEF